jgi:hypothetical protein
MNYPVVLERIAEVRRRVGNLTINGRVLLKWN